jgi:hypothetical protein
MTRRTSKPAQASEEPALEAGTPQAAPAPEPSPVCLGRHFPSDGIRGLLIRWRGFTLHEACCRVLEARMAPWEG